MEVPVSNVIALPVGQRRPDCRICVHALIGDETFCSLFREPIMFEQIEAPNCAEYEDDPFKS